jgi:hypothetical protein
MSRTRWGILFGSLLLIFTIAVWAVILRWASTVPTALSGDPWDYAILLSDLPANWSLAQQDITTPYDVAQVELAAATSVTATSTLTVSPALQNMTEMYAVRYQPPDTSGYADFTCQVILYQSDLDAQAAMAVEAPGPEWESAPAPTVGDEAHLWHFKNPDPSVKENIYRVDFRYLNGLASLTLMGTAQAVPDSKEVVGYATKILDKMKKAVTPPDLKRLQSAGYPDLRRYLLTQEQLAQGDVYLGNHWIVATQQLPGWTPTSIMSAEAQKALAPLGRVTGYQMFYYKSLSQDELKGAGPVLLFQQVTAYTQAANAQKGLDMMLGITQLDEFPDPPQIGDGKTHAWKGEVSTTQSDGTTAIVALSEIDFRIGNYVASVKLQSRPLSDTEISRVDKATNKVQVGIGLLQTTQMADAYARLLAQNLQRPVK